MDSTDLGNLSYQIRNCVNNREKTAQHRQTLEENAGSMAMTWMKILRVEYGYDTVWSMVKRLFVGKHLAGNYGFYMFFMSVLRDERDNMTLL